MRVLDRVIPGDQVTGVGAGPGGDDLGERLGLLTATLVRRGAPASWSSSCGTKWDLSASHFDPAAQPADERGALFHCEFDNELLSTNGLAIYRTGYR